MKTSEHVVFCCVLLSFTDVVLLKISYRKTYRNSCINPTLRDIYIADILDS